MIDRKLHHIGDIKHDPCSDGAMVPMTSAIIIRNKVIGSVEGSTG